VRVHITQPDRAVFEDEKTPTTASVTVDLRAGRELSDRQVGAIRHLVASAVEGLEPGDVTVVTTDGALLSRSGTDEANTAALDYESDLERDLENRIGRLLERTVGVGGVEVTVAAEVDFSHTNTTEESYDPEQTALRSESLQEAHEGAGANRPLGVAGAESNQPGAAAPTTAAGADASSKLVRARNFEVNKTVVHTVGPKALVKRLSVAVLVDGHYTPVEGGEPQFTARTEEELAELQSVVENAMGYNAARGDRVKLASVPFRDRAADNAGMQAATEAFPPWMMAAAGGAALLLVALVFLLRKKKPARVVADQVLQLPQSVSAAQAALVRAESGGVLPNATSLALPEAAEGTRDRVLELAAADPERTADIIRAWLRADQPT
jgi:flagellar M-ring protein FliF